jgi:amyloid beta precursor protein binding protein 1
LNAKSTSFWIIARAVREFIENEGKGLTPVAGTLPDMKADTESFVGLQTVYREKARQDVAVVYKRVQALLVSLDIPEDRVTMEQVEIFCKNCQHLKLLRYSSLRDEYSSDLSALSLLFLTKNPIFKNSKTTPFGIFF